MSAGTGMALGLLDQQWKRRVIVDVDPAADLGQRSAMSVVGVFAEAQVGDHQEIRRNLPGKADGLLDDAVVAGGGRAARVFVLRDAEEDDAGYTQFGDLGETFAQPVDRELILTRHRGNLAPEVSAVIDKQRVDQVERGELGFANEVAKSRMAAETAGPMQGVTGGGLYGHGAIPRGATSLTNRVRRAAATRGVWTAEGRITLGRGGFFR